MAEKIMPILALKNKFGMLPVCYGGTFLQLNIER